MHPLYEIRPLHIFITSNNPTFEKKKQLNKQVPGCFSHRKTAFLDDIIHPSELLRKRLAKSQLHIGVKEGLFSDKNQVVNIAQAFCSDM